MKYKDVHQQSIQAVRNCLSAVPSEGFTEFQEGAAIANGRPDLVGAVQIDGKRQVLLVETRENGEPRRAREAVNQIYQYLRELPNAYGIVVAPYISPQAAGICREAGVGYLDLAGNCHLSFGHVYIEKEGKPNPYNSKRNLKSLYSPKAERVLRVLLNSPGTTWQLQHLAKAAEVSIGQAFKTKALLADKEWLHVSRDGLKLNRPLELLEEWAKNYNSQRGQTQNLYSVTPIHELEFDVARVCAAEGISYALTGFSGATRLAAYTRYLRGVIYCNGNIEKIKNSLNLKEVPTGHTLSIMTPYDEGVFAGCLEVEGVCIASPVQIYLDLRAIPGRGEESAQYLLEEVIKPKWQLDEEITRKTKSRPPGAS